MFLAIIDPSHFYFLYVFGGNGPISHTVMVTLRFKATHKFQHTYTATLNSFCNILNLLQSITAPMPGEPADTKRLWLLIALSSVAHSSGIANSSQCCCCGILDNQSGPCLHIKLDFNSLREIPRDGRSAGFSLPGQWDQRTAGTNLCISVTLLCTNGFHCLSSPLIQNNATIESVKHDPTCVYLSLV